VKLDRVTITGADDQTSIAQMAEFSDMFSFVEWGILVSRSQEGAARFPSAHNPSSEAVHRAADYIG